MIPRIIRESVLGYDSITKLKLVLDAGSRDLFSYNDPQKILFENLEFRTKLMIHWLIVYQEKSKEFNEKKIGTEPAEGKLHHQEGQRRRGEFL